MVPTSFILKSGDFDLREYEVVRTQFFASANITSANFSRSGIRFSSVCVRKFYGNEYIELLVHPKKQLIVVRPCSEQHKNAMRWARINNDGISSRMVSGAAFLKTLYDLFDWDVELRYRLRGEALQYAGKTVVLFDVRMPEIFVSRYDMQIPWATGFGENYYSYKASRLPRAPIYDIFAEYNNEPGLQPTMPEIACENVRLLTNKWSRCSEGVSPCGDR